MPSYVFLSLKLWNTLFRILRQCSSLGCHFVTKMSGIIYNCHYFNWIIKPRLFLHLHHQGRPWPRSDMEPRWVLGLESCCPVARPEYFPRLQVSSGLNDRCRCVFCWVEPRSCCWCGVWTQEVFVATDHSCILLFSCCWILLLYKGSSALGCTWYPEPFSPSTSRQSEKPLALATELNSSLHIVGSQLTFCIGVLRLSVFSGVSRTQCCKNKHFSVALEIGPRTLQMSRSPTEICRQP